MREILRIVAKDVRALWLRVVIVVAITTSLWWRAFSLLSNPDAAGAISLIDIVRMLAYWYLIASVIHEERLTGDRSYWVTRPFSRPRLLAAKTLFIAVFVNLPVFAFEAASLEMHGVSPWPHLPVLLTDQFFFTAKYVLPAVAVAVVSASLPQFIGIALAAAAAGYFVLGSFGIPDSLLAPRWAGAEWVRTTALDGCLFAIAAAILLLQYGRRKTALSRCLLAGGVALTACWPALGLRAGAWLTPRQQRPADRSSIRVSYDPGWGTIPVLVGDDSTIDATIPIEVMGIPTGTELVMNTMSVRLDSPELHRSWESGPLVPSNESVGRNLVGLRSLPPFTRVFKTDGHYLPHTYWPLAQNLASAPLHVQATFAFTLMGLPEVTPLSPSSGPQRLPAGGFCAVTAHRENYILAVSSWPFAIPGIWALRVTSRVTGESKTEDFNPPWFEAPFSTKGAVWQTFYLAMTPPAYPYDMALETRQPTARIDRDVEIPLVRINSEN